MTTTEPRVLQPGEPAPDFTLPAVHRDGTVSLADYRGRSPLLLAFFRGILMDRDGIVRWVNLGIAKEGLAGIGKFPSDEELLAVARAHSYFPVQK